MDSIIASVKFIIGGVVLMVSIDFLREMNWIFRSFVATVILVGALYIATEHLDLFILQWMKIFGGILIYTLILAPDSDK